MIEGIIAALLGVIFGVGGTVAYEKKRVASGKSEIERELAKAKTKAGDIVLKAKDEAISLENDRRNG